MSIIEDIEKRRSIRKYLDVPLEWSTTFDIIKTILYAPCSGNLQNTRVIIVIDKEKKKELASASFNQLWMETAPVILVICSDTSYIEKHYSKRGKKLYAIQNTALAAQNIMLTAAHYDLGTCFVGKFSEDAVRRALKIPDNIDIHLMITLGYPDEKPFSKRKEELKNIVFFEEWGNKERDTDLWPIYKHKKKIQEKVKKKKPEIKEKSKKFLKRLLKK